MKTTLIEGCRIVSGSKTWYERMRSLWGKWFGVTKHSLNWTEQWTDIIVCAGLQKIHTFMWKKKSFTGPQRLVWTVIKGTNWTILFWRYHYWSSVPRHTTHIHFTCNSYNFGEGSILLPTRWRPTALPPRRESFPRWEFARTMVRTKRCGWVSPTFSWLNNPWLLPMGDLKGRGVP